jgi:hypothetical protein
VTASSTKTIRSQRFTAIGEHLRSASDLRDDVRSEW